MSNTTRVQKTVTLLSQLDLSSEQDNKHEEYENKHNEESLRQIATNLFHPLPVRLRALINQANQEGDEVCETISTLTGMYQFSQTKNLEEYLSAISDCRELPVIFRIDCAKTLPSGYDHIYRMLTIESDQVRTLPTPMRVQTVMYLIDSEAYKETARECLCQIVLDTTIDGLYRFKTLQSLESHFLSKIVVTSRRRRGAAPLPPPATQPAPEKLAAFLYHATYVARKFMQFVDNLFTYRVLAAQYLLEKCNPENDADLTKECDTFLLTVAENAELDEDVRADACDVILQYGSDEARDAARRLLFVLGGGEQSRNNIYKNSQNVHIRAIEDSVQRIVDQLASYHPENGRIYSFSEVCDEIREHLGDEKNDEVEGALTRISIDRAVYGHTNMALTTILAKVWTYIQDSAFREELEKRLIEELVESNNKCSSGYASRLVNTLSGFDDKMSITISFEDQIISNLEARLNARIRTLTDENQMEQILDQMTIPVIEFDKRGAFLKFFRENISKIREEMYSEFCSHMDDTDYDFYFRKAIIHYEGCH